MNKENVSIEEFELALLSIDRIEARTIFKGFCRGKDPLYAADNLIIPALESIGDKWEKGELALSQVYMGGKICEELIEESMPESDTHWKNQPKIAIGVFEDYHVLGKRIVYSALRASGYDLIDLGHGLKTPGIINRIKEDRIEILLLSTLMLPSSLGISKLIDKIKEEKLNVKVAVGGAPFRFDNNLWKEIGADAMGRTASEALDIIRNFTGGIKDER